MKRLFPILAAIGAVITCVGASAFAQQVAPIASNNDGALDRPESWSCDRILPEYRTYLEAGNPAEDWRYVGQTYYDNVNDTAYDWNDWLRWVKRSDCELGPVTDCELGPVMQDQPRPSAFGGPAVIGVLVGIAGAGVLAASGGGRQAISPG